uniref:Uncharacterized protein n=1 Tax=Rhizophora mucronata TaxID=61149 RepID=A0A2P2Q9I1_RHIMU
MGISGFLFYFMSHIFPFCVLEVAWRKKRSFRRYCIENCHCIL